MSKTIAKQIHEVLELEGRARAGNPFTYSQVINEDDTVTLTLHKGDKQLVQITRDQVKFGSTFTDKVVVDVEATKEDKIAIVEFLKQV